MTDAELLAEIEGAPAPAEIRARALAQGASGGTFDEAKGGIAALESSAKAPWSRTPGPRALALLYPGVPYAEAAAKWFEEHRPDVESATAAEQGRQAAPEAYQQTRDADRAANGAARKADPKGYLLWQLAGGAAPAIATGGSGYVGAAGLGAAQAAGYSNAPPGWGLVGDTGVGALVGAGGQLVGQGIGKAAGWVGSKVKERLGAALAKATADEAAKRSSAFSSALGSYRNARAETNRVVEAIRGLLSESNLSPEQRATLEALKGSPEYAEAVKSLVSSLEERLPEVSGKLAQGRAGMEAVNALEPVTEAAAKRVAPKAAGEQLKARLLRYGPPAVGSAIGAAIGGPVGVGVGALAGAGTRPMIHSLRRMVQDPAVQTTLLRPLLGAAEAGASEGGRAMTQGLTRAAAGAAPLSLTDYLRKREEDKAAEAELERLLRE